MTTATKNLTPRQHEALNYVRTYTAARGYAPTYAEIGRALNVRRNTAHEFVRKLEDRGAVRVDRNTARGISIPDRDGDALGDRLRRLWRKSGRVFACGGAAGMLLEAMNYAKGDGKSLDGLIAWAEGIVEEVADAR